MTPWCQNQETRGKIKTVCVFTQFTRPQGILCRPQDVFSCCCCCSFSRLYFCEGTVHLFVSDHFTVWVNILKFIIDVNLRYCHYIQYKATLLFLAWLSNFWNTWCCLRVYDTTCGNLNLHFQVRQPGSYFLAWTVQIYTCSAVLSMHRVGGERGILEGRK